MGEYASGSVPGEVLIDGVGAGDGAAAGALTVGGATGGGACGTLPPGGGILGVFELIKFPFINRCLNATLYKANVFSCTSIDNYDRRMTTTIDSHPSIC